MLVIKFYTEEEMNAMRAYLEALEDTCPVRHRSWVLDKDKLELGVNVLHVDEATAIAERFGGKALHYIVP